MRGLSILDILIISAVLLLLLYAGSRDFARYDSRTMAPPPTATSQGSS